MAFEEVGPTVMACKAPQGAASALPSGRCQRGSINGEVEAMWPVFVIVALALIVRAAAADLDAGVRAYQTGDHVTALREFREAAEQGNALAQSNLGVIYGLGLGVPEDAVESAKWHRLAAEQGHAPSQTTLGMMYLSGLGVPKDEIHAVRWIRLAASQGEAEAQYYLGRMYSSGQGVLPDVVEAAKWYRLAADQGHPSAQFLLGLMYSAGQGVLEDPAEAVKWWRRAAAQGVPKAQLSLGMMYAQGHGVPRNLVEAYVWTNLAAAQGVDEANKFLEVLERRLSQAALHQARKRSRDLMGNLQKRRQGESAALSTEAAPSRGSTLIRDIQSALTSKGYNPGQIDGQMGRNTRAAIQAFQRAKGLPQTGQPSAELLMLIKAH
ncbi:MAG: SEL1-like repeat protein [Gammaproteobacteria bacterium]|nr:SEL1-like repeat protein [Gammaproteobacteria bacterium]